MCHESPLSNKVLNCSVEECFKLSYNVFQENKVGQESGKIRRLCSNEREGKLNEQPGRFDASTINNRTCWLQERLCKK